LQDSAYISFGTDFEESTATLYTAYCDWCNKNLLTALKKDTFSSWLKSNAEKNGITFNNHIKTANRREVRGFKGLKTHFISILQ
jgi:putative DNA primase/helicase